jgi:hypothetical protein
MAKSGQGVAQRAQCRVVGFGPTKTRSGLLFKRIMPKYVFPLLVCTTGAMVSLFD